MNNDLFMNDTLDNINFSQDLITKDVSAVKNSQNKPPNAPQNWASEEIKKKEISLDDSVFLSGSLETDVSNEKENTPLSNKVDALNEIQSRKGKQPNEFIKDPCFSEPHCTKYSGQTSISEKTPKKEKDSLSNEASQIDFDNACKLSSWGFPNEILQKYESKNLHKMFRWQVECLNKQDVLKNYKNLVYAAPTSAGKTLVAEILALKTVLERKKKVIFILPFISIVQEKMYYFQDLLGSSGVRVEGFMGSYNPPGGFSAVQVAICTIEKANSLINRLLEEEKVSDVGAILVDEIHMLGDPSRGYLLELLLTKLLYISKKNENIKLQIIGMSATLPNLDQLAKWLNAELYTTDFRPIPLYELVHVCGEIYDKDLKLVRKLKPLEGVATDTDNILQLCLETIQESCSVLIFCPTKNWCESLAQQIAVSFCKLGNAKNQWGELLRLQLNTNLIMEVLEQLKFCPVGLDDLLRRTVSFGVAFHHAGLTMDERDIIEGAFRSGALRVLVATSTLSSGVNLPARRVIVRTAVFHQGRPLGPLTYRQMIGRAGRMGKDTVGESILVCQRNDYRVAKALLNAPLAPVQSCLEGAGKLKRAVLEVVASGVASTPEDVDLFARCTLLAATTNARGDSNSDSDAEEGLENPIEEAVTFLKDNEFIRLQKQDDGTETYAATSLGKACLSSSVAPDEGLALFTELDKARQCFVLETELHLIYLVTPYSACHSWGNLDWMFYLELWQQLPRSMKKVGELVGVRESYLVSATRGKLHTDTTKSYHKLLVHKRFFVALALQDLVNEKPLGWVCAKFSCNRGLLQSLQQSASVFAGMVSSFSRQLGWSSVELLVSQFQERLQFGVSRDLLDLMRLPILNGKIARTLFDAGVETVAQLANAKPAHVEEVLYKATPFETVKGKEGESEYAQKQRNRFRNVWVTGKEGLTEREAAEMLVNEARKYLKLEMGLVDAKWNADTSEADVEVTNVAKHTAHQEPSTNQREVNGKSEQDKAEETEKQTSEETPKAEDCKDVEMSIQNVSSDCSLFGSETNISNSSINEPLPELSNHGQNEEIGNKRSPNDNQNVSNTSILEKSHEFLKTNHSEEINDKNALKIAENDNQNMPNTSIRESSLEFLKSNHSEEISNKRGNENKKAEGNQNVLNATYVKDDFDSFSNVNLSEIERAVSSNSHGKDSPSKRREVSDALSSSSSRELNISSGSACSPVNVTLDKMQSDESLFDSFNLHLSGSSSSEEKNVVVREEMDTMAVLQNAFAESFDKDCSSDIFDTSEDEAETKKRKNASMGAATPSKKLKGCGGSEMIPVSLSFAEDKFCDGDAVDLNRIEVVNVCDDSGLFDLFAGELKRRRRFSLSLACSRVAEIKSTIGLGTTKCQTKSEQPKRQFAFKSSMLNGIAVAWGANVVYYLSLEATHQLTSKVAELLKAVLMNEAVRVKMFDSKEQIKMLRYCLDVQFNAKVDDPNVADWLLDPDATEKNLLAMMVSYFPEGIKLAQLAGRCRGVGGIGLDITGSVEAKKRSAIEAVLIWHLVDSLKKRLEDVQLSCLDVYDLETDVVVCLSRMELNGISVKKSVFQELEETLKAQLAAIERKAYSLAGRRFNFVSSTDVAKVIGMFRGRKVSTRKQVLEKNDHPISELVLTWRKVNCTLTKTLYPLMRVTEEGEGGSHHPHHHHQRIHGCSITHTATGRISMHEPNLQNIPKDFQLLNPITKEEVSISCRRAFGAPDGWCLLSADYCQLELRILTHLSRDPLLVNIMSRPGDDVFRSIAAKWNKVDVHKVDDRMRQHTKHLCYGIIYGMGAKALSEQLEIEEEDALAFMEAFKNTYPALKTFIRETVEKCRRNGYVETLTGRRRYLPNINDDTDPTKRGQAERQAVNSVVQGSAADIAKRAMIAVQREFRNAFGCTSKTTDRIPKLVLQLHDELLYEVPSTEKHLRKAAVILKKGMERSVRLSVPFPVKLKTGPDWAHMTEYIPCDILS